jgi:hypothetical protein
MIEFNVTLEMQILAKDPKDAAEKLENCLKEDTNLIYMVQNNETKELFSVDMEEIDEECQTLPVNIQDYVPIIN